VRQQFNKHRSKARSQAHGLESTPVSVTVWINGAGKRTVMVIAGDTAQLLSSGQRENLLTLTRSEQSSRNMPAPWQGKVIDRWFVRVVCFECAERTKALMWFVALRSLLFRLVDS
jgi:predicted ATPase